MKNPLVEWGVLPFITARLKPLEPEEHHWSRNDGYAVRAGVIRETNHLP